MFVKKTTDLLTRDTLQGSDKYETKRGCLTFKSTIKRLDHTIEIVISIDEIVTLFFNIVIFSIVRIYELKILNSYFSKVTVVFQLHHISIIWIWIRFRMFESSQICQVVWFRDYNIARVSLYFLLLIFLLRWISFTYCSFFLFFAEINRRTLSIR